ncbi:hypothetical protein LCM4573_11890 [Rhizobium sp. LCM 4573]|nr:hypothetical protein LCM4573_11890 [Rhizobium sp. LCM 4573]
MRPLRIRFSPFLNAGRRARPAFAETAGKSKKVTPIHANVTRRAPDTNWPYCYGTGKIEQPAKSHF